MVILAGNWWTFVLRGIFAILFGLILFIRPDIGVLTLVFLFGIYAIADGVFSVVAAFRRPGGTGADQPPWWALLIAGILSIAAGVLAFVLPIVTAVALLYLVAAWAIVTGAFWIAAAIRLRKQIRGEWLLALTGVLSIVLGVLLAVFPRAGALALVIWVGAFAVAYGILLIMLGVRLRKWVREVDHLVHGVPATGH
jgi:uncharacterized membrane protein HdeD (DUF308 family)